MRQTQPRTKVAASGCAAKMSGASSAWAAAAWEPQQRLALAFSTPPPKHPIQKRKHATGLVDLREFASSSQRQALLPLPIPMPSRRLLPRPALRLATLGALFASAAAQPGYTGWVHDATDSCSTVVFESTINDDYCIDIVGGHATNGTAIILAECSDATSQQWLQAWSPSGFAVFMTLAPNAPCVSLSGGCIPTSFCLDVNGTASASGPVTLWQCNGGQGQRWRPRPYPAESSGNVAVIIYEGDYGAEENGYCLDMEGEDAPPEGDGSIKLWECDDLTGSNGMVCRAVAVPRPPPPTPRPLPAHARAARPRRAVHVDP